MVGKATELQIVDSYSTIFQQFLSNFVVSTLIILVYCGVILEVAPSAPSESAAHVRSPSYWSLFVPANRLHSAGVSVYNLKKLFLSIAGSSYILLEISCNLIIYLFIAFRSVFLRGRNIIGVDVYIIFLIEVGLCDV